MITEQTLIDISYFLVHELYQNIAYYAVFMFMLTPKYGKALSRIMIAVMAAASICCSYIARSLPTPVSYLFYQSLMLLPILLFYKEKKKTCLFAAALIEAATFIMDMTVSACLLKIFGYYPTKVLPYTWSTILVVLLLDVFITCFYALIVIIWRKRLGKYSVKSMTLFMLFPVGQLLFIMACTYPTWAMGSTFDVFDNPFMIAAAIASVASDILMFIALRENNSLETANERAAQAEKEMELQLQYYSELTEKMTEIREYRHDINNLVSVAEAMITESTSQTGRDYIDEMKRKAESMKFPVYTSSEIANAVLWKKEREARQVGVDFKVRADISESFPLDKIDICSLFANLLDNAVNEAKETEEKTVEVTAGRRFGLLMVEVVNSADNNLEITGRKKLKSAKDGDHGHGLGIVEKIAEKYDGRFVFEVKDGKARAAVSLSV